VDEVETLVVGDLASVHPAAVRTQAPLLWLRAPGVVANDDTLPELMRAGDAPAVSVPLTPSGEPAEDWLGTFADGDVDAVVEAARGRRAPLRFTPLYSLLAPRELVLAHAPPDPRFGPYADLEWSARLFAKQPGMLVPASTVTVPPRPHPIAPRALLRFGPGTGLRRTDLFRPIRLAWKARRG
jgi:hypothetical protein